MLTKDTMIKTVFSQALDSLLLEKELEDKHITVSVFDLCLSF